MEIVNNTNTFLFVSVVKACTRRLSRGADELLVFVHVSFSFTSQNVVSLDFIEEESELLFFMLRCSFVDSLCK